MANHRKLKIIITVSVETDKSDDEIKQASRKGAWFGLGDVAQQSLIYVDSVEINKATKKP